MEEDFFISNDYDYDVVKLENEETEKENEISDFRLLGPKRFDTAQVLSTWPFQTQLIFVTDTTDGVCGEKLVMWRNSPHDMLSSGKFLHMINVEKNLSWSLNVKKVLHV